MKKNKLVKDIEPNRSRGINLLKAENGDELIDLIIEEPLKEPCRAFKAKGIETVMSSANKNNVLQEGEKAIEKDDVKRKELFLHSPTFESAGKGYAWIMLNYDSLSEENKNILFLMEERIGKDGEKTGEKYVWFVHDFFGNLINLGKGSINTDPSVKKFNQHAICMRYNNLYPERVVMLRMPITENTEISEVSRYFTGIAEVMKVQELEKDKDKEQQNER